MKTKIVSFEDLQIGDWFHLDYLDSRELILIEKDYEKKMITFTSPDYLAWTTINTHILDGKTFEVIGTSKNNFWYRFFFKFELICPWKRVNLV